MNIAAGYHSHGQALSLNTVIPARFCAMFWLRKSKCSESFAGEKFIMMVVQVVNCGEMFNNLCVASIYWYTALYNNPYRWQVSHVFWETGFLWSLDLWWDNVGQYTCNILIHLEIRLCLLWLFLRESVLCFPILSKFHPRMYPLSARNPNVASELAQWNLHFEEDLQKIEGRQLPQENIMMLDNRGRGDCAVSVTVFSASWPHPSPSRATSKCYCLQCLLATPQSQ